MLDAVHASVRASTPGVPYNVLASSKGEIFERFGDLVPVVFFARLLKLMGDVPTDAVELVKGGYCDPIYTFVKDEPHKAEKLVDDRLRLISGVSVVDTLIERLLYGHQGEWELALHDCLQFKPGMGLHDEGKQRLYAEMCAMQKVTPVTSTDISGWDWSVKGWLLDMDRDFRLKLNGAETGGWKKLVTGRFVCHGLKVFCLPGGNLWAQTEPGVVPSGTYITSSGNSHMRCMAATLVNPCYPAYGIAMGDDMIEPTAEQLVEKYRKLGFRVKGATLAPPGDFSFCSTHFDGDWMGEPEGWRKTLVRFLHRKRSDPNIHMLRSQLAYDLRHLRRSDIGARIDGWMADTSIQN